MSAVERLDAQHALIAPAVLYVAHQDDVCPDPAFSALGAVLAGWEIALRAVLALHAPVEWQAANQVSGEMDEDSLKHPLPPFCRECSDAVLVAAVEFGDMIDQDSGGLVYCPCPTVAAVTTPLGPS